MAKIRVAGFMGENRAIHPMLIPEGTGVTSLNQKPGRGDLRPWNAPLERATVPAGRKTIYRMGRDVPSDTNYWLTWTTDVHAVRGPNADDTDERTYFTGSGTPKWTTKTLALASAPYPTAYRELGIPAPASACTLSFTNPAPTVVDSNETAQIANMFGGGAYIEFTTLSNHFIAEGESVTFSGTYDDPTNTGLSFSGTKVAHVIDSYRFRVDDTFAATVIAVTGTVSYVKHTAVQPVADTRAYTYTYVTAEGFESAPATASELITCQVDSTVTIANLAAEPGGSYGINRIRIYRTQNGEISSGFYFVKEISSNLSSTTDSTVTLGELLPSTTWTMPPADLSHLTGLWNGMLAGISGRSVRFCEAFVPYAWPLAYEILPASVSPVALATFGQTLVMLTDGNPSLITGGSPDAMDETPMEFLQACIAPLSAVGLGHGVAWASPDGLAYVGQGGARMLTDGLMTREDWQALNPSTIQGCVYERRYFGFFNDGSRKGFMVDPLNPQGIYFMDFGCDALYVDDQQDALFVLDGVSIKKWDAGAALTTTFKSKVFHLPKPTQAFAAAEVVASSYPATFKLYADGALVHTQTVANANPFRLPGGYHAQDVQIEVSTSGAIQAIAMAHSITELSQV